MWKIGKEKIGYGSKFWRIGMEKKIIECGSKFWKIGKEKMNSQIP